MENSAAITDMIIQHFRLCADDKYIRFIATYHSIVHYMSTIMKCQPYSRLVGIENSLYWNGQNLCVHQLLRLYLRVRDGLCPG